MASQDSQGRFVPPAESLAGAQVASAARTTTGNGTAFDTSGVDSIKGLLVISAASGTTPTLDVTLETTADGTNYYTVQTWTQRTATNGAGDTKIGGPVGDLSRWKWTIAGTTPSFTFAITATIDRDA